MSTASSRFVVVAEFQVKPGHLEPFLALGAEDASQSLSNEPECHQFDIITQTDEPDTVIFYEVYSSREAFEHHKQMPHFAPFKTGSAPLLAAEPKVRFFNKG